MRLLHVVPTYVPAWRHGGPVAAVHGLCKALAARGHEVTVFTTNVHGEGTLDVPTGEPVALDGVTVWYFPVTFPRRLYRSPAMGAALRRLLPRPGTVGAGGAARGGSPAPPGPATPDLVHLHSVFLWPTATAGRAARRAGVPYIVAPRGMLVGDLLRRRGRLRKRLWIDLVERRTLAGAAALHVTSDIEAAEAARLGLRLPPAFVVPNGIDSNTVGDPDAAAAPPPANGTGPAGPFPSRLPLPAPAEPPPPGMPRLGTPRLAPAVCAVLERRPLLLFLGRMSWKKGLDRLVAALPAVSGATLAIAGNDEEAYRGTLERQAAASGVAERVVFLGPVHGADKAALLGGADLLVLSSYSENFGNVVLEAMAAGLPVAVTPEVGLAKVVAEAGAGIVSPGDPAILGPHLAALLADGEARAQMGRRGAAVAAERFGWAAVARQMESAYEDALRQPRGQPS